MTDVQGAEDDVLVQELVRLKKSVVVQKEINKQLGVSEQFVDAPGPDDELSTRRKVDPIAAALKVQSVFRGHLLRRRRMRAAAEVDDSELTTRELDLLVNELVRLRHSVNAQRELNKQLSVQSELRVEDGLMSPIEASQKIQAAFRGHLFRRHSENIGCSERDLDDLVSTLVRTRKKALVQRELNRQLKTEYEWVDGCEGQEGAEAGKHLSPIEACTRIQAMYRGHRQRNSSKDVVPGEADDEGLEDLVASLVRLRRKAGTQRELNKQLAVQLQLEMEREICGGEPTNMSAIEASSRIQAAFRGHTQRKLYLQKHYDCDDEELDSLVQKLVGLRRSATTQRELNRQLMVESLYASEEDGMSPIQAAKKIQSAFRGHSTRGTVSRDVSKLSYLTDSTDHMSVPSPTTATDVHTLSPSQPTMPAQGGSDSVSTGIYGLLSASDAANELLTAVHPAVQYGLEAVAVNRPADPVRFLAEKLLEYRAEPEK